MEGRVMRAALLLPLLAATTARGEDYLRYLPSDTKVVLTVHVGRLAREDRDRGRALIRLAYQKFVCPSLGKDEPLPFSDLDRVVVALPYAGTLNGVLLVRGKIDRRRFEAQMRRRGSAASSEAVGRPAATVFACKPDPRAVPALLPALAKVPPPLRKLVAPEKVYLAALDDSTLIASLAGPAPVARALRARPVKSLPRIGTELADLLRTPVGSDVATLVITEDSLHPALQLVADGATREAFEQIESIRLHVRGGKRTEIEVVVQARSSDLGPALEKKAGRAVDFLRGEAAKEVADPVRRAAFVRLARSLRVTRDGGRVMVKGSMSEADARQFVEGGGKE